MDRRDRGRRDQQVGMLGAGLCGRESPRRPNGVSMPVQCRPSTLHSAPCTGATSALTVWDRTLWGASGESYTTPTDP